MPQPEDLEYERLLRVQLDMVAGEGWQIRRQKITEMFTKDMASVGLGQIKDPVERDITVGRCRAFNEILDMDKQVIKAWEELQLERNEAEREPELEGGDHPVTYEASQ